MAVATGTYSFVRTFGMVWGVTIASVVFNGQVDAHIGLVTDTATRNLLANGAAYSFASSEFIGSLKDGTRTEVVAVYVWALRAVWAVLAAVCAVGFFCVFIEKHAPLREKHQSEYGLAESSKSGTDAEKNESAKGGDVGGGAA